MSELDFLVEQRPGPKIRHADVLSQHAGTVMLANTLDKKSISHEQDRAVSSLNATMAPCPRRVRF